MEQQPSTSGVSAKKSKQSEPCVFSGKHSDEKCFCHTLFMCIINKKSEECTRGPNHRATAQFKVIRKPRR